MKLSRAMLYILAATTGLTLGLFATSPVQADAPKAPSKETSDTIVLPKPNTKAGIPLMQAIEQRKSTRAFADNQLNLQTISDLIWVAGGINRPDKGGITIPTALAAKDIDVFAMTRQGVYVYDAKNHRLKLLANGDHRHLAGLQAFAATAPLTLFFVADQARMKVQEPSAKERFGAMTAAYASQNVYLYCASANLATVVRASFDEKALSELLKLRPEQRLYLAQSVGMMP